MMDKIGKLFNRKGDITAKFLITFILLIMGFIILLVFLYNFVSDPIVDRETCHQSVVYRATAKEAFEAASGIVPLKCKEAKYCVTTSTGILDRGGKCNEKYDDGRDQPFVGEENIRRVNVDSEEDIERFLAREILDCWKTMGEGKVSLMAPEGIWKYLGEDILGDARSSCLICSRVAFDNDRLEEEGINISEVDLFFYMATHKPPESSDEYDNYLEYIGRDTGISYDLLGGEDDIISMVEEDEDAEEGDIEEVDTQKEDEEIAIMFMQAASEDGWDVLENFGSYAAGAGIGSSFLIGIKATVSAAVSVPAAVVGGLFMGYQQLNVAFQNSVTVGRCGDVEVGGEASKGCSVIRVVPYESEAIGQYCSKIESIP